MGITYEWGACSEVGTILYDAKVVVLRRIFELLLTKKWVLVMEHQPLYILFVLGF